MVLNRRELGDWQTPDALARAALGRIARIDSDSPATILEPTCGKGAFLAVAAARFPESRLVGFEIRPDYAESARARAPRARIEVADFFRLDWERILAGLPEPILVAGNPPWVTNAALGALDSKNLPDKHNWRRLRGLDARTGKSNFDVSEWMILRLLHALRGRRATLAMLCKTAVARRVIEAAGDALRPGGLWRIDAMAHFDAAVEACLFVGHLGAGEGRTSWPVYDSLESDSPASEMGFSGDALVADWGAFVRSSHLAGTCEPAWRSGIKHDCAAVMELAGDGEGFRNKLGEPVDVEPEYVFPLRKGTDIARAAARSPRFVLVPQRSLGEATDGLRARAPRLWAYLSAHRAKLAARKSRIYRGQPEFAVFGVGAYSFAPWKVAVSGLHKRCAFAVLGPEAGRPVMLDDTCYFLPFDHEPAARAACAALRSPEAEAFLRARIFWDAKRPITKAVLQTLDLRRLGLHFPPPP